MRPFWIIFFVLVLGCSQQKETPLRIATAANAQYVIQEAAQRFEAQTGTPCQVITGSSGKLYAQVLAGANFHVFISADAEYPAALHSAGLTHADPQPYAWGELVVWSVKDGGLYALDSTAMAAIDHFALPNPETAPYGRLAKAALEKGGVWSQLQDRIVLGESVGQTSQFIQTGAADVGITARSMVEAPGMNDQGHWQPLPQDWYVPLEQQVVTIATEQHHIQAPAFMTFLLAPAQDSLFEGYGYIRSR